MKAMLGIIVALMVCGQIMFAQGLTRDSRQADQEATYSGFTTNYDAASSDWKINGTNFGMGQQLLMRNNLNGRLYTTMLFADGSMAYDATNTITANLMSMMDNIGLATNDSAINWDVNAIGDVNGDGVDEVVIAKTAAGGFLWKKILFFADNGTVTSAGPEWWNGTKWVIEGMGVFDTNSRSFKPSTKAQQILMRNNLNGRLYTAYVGTNDTWHYDTNDFTRSTMSMMDNIGLATNDSAVNWTVDAIGDVNGDGKDEVVLAKIAAGGYLWKKILFFGDNGSVASAGQEWWNGTKWRIEGTGLFDTNSRSFKPSTKAQQILMRNNENGRLYTAYVGTNDTWHYDTNDFTRSTMSMMDNIGLATNDSALNWAVQAIGDVNGDGKDEVLISKAAAGGYLWKKVLFFGDNGTVTSAGPEWWNGTKWIIKGFGRSR